MAIHKLIILCLLITRSSTLKETLSRYEFFYEVTAFNNHERSFLYNLQMNNESVIFLNGVTNEAAIPMQIIVDRCCVILFENQLQDEGIEYIKHDDLSAIYQCQTRTSTHTEDYDMATDFIKWQDVGMWIESKQKKSPLLQKIVISNTYEKRELFILSIVKKKENPAVVIVGGEQGKDWMSAAIIFNVINIFVDMKYLVSVLEYYSFYFLPILNPDGYEFSMVKDRFWDKNRKVFFPNKKCNREYGADNEMAIGVNIERNWYFGKSLGSGDGTECSSFYLGHKSLSEEEPKALANFLNIHAINIMAFFNVKGFGGRVITLPYSDATMKTNNHGVVMEIIMSACEKVYQKYNSTYFHGSSARFFYNISGNSADWVKKYFNIPIVSTMHMRFKDESFPHSEHIESLSHELITIINEILMISKEIYGPLFNHQVNVSCDNNPFTVITIFLVHYVNIFMQ